MPFFTIKPVPVYPVTYEKHGKWELGVSRERLKQNPYLMSFLPILYLNISFVFQRREVEEVIVVWFS